MLNDLIKRIKKHGNIHNEEEANRVMQKMIDEPIEMFDIFSALEQSKEEGELIGQERGEQIGENRGRKQERLETARGLLADNVPDDKVIRYSRITASELDKLKEELRDKT